MKITIYGRINVEGQWWDVAFELEKELDGYRALTKTTQGSIMNLKKVGWVSPVAGPSPSLPQSNGRALNDSPMPQGNGIPPRCSAHRANMKLSDFQDVDGKQMWYCSKKDGDGD